MIGGRILELRKELEIREIATCNRKSQLVLEKEEEPEIKLPTSAGSWKKQESSRKTSISALLIMPKPLIVWITISSVQSLSRV